VTPSCTEGATAGLMGEGGTGICIMMMDVRKILNKRMYSPEHQNKIKLKWHKMSV